MPHAIVDGLTAPIDRAFGLLAQFIEVCPEEIWVEKNGGWPVWQQMYHALVAVYFFVELPGEPAPPPLARVEIGSLREEGAEPLTKDQLRAALGTARTWVERHLAGLGDGDLSQLNAPLQAKTKLEITQAGTLAMIAAHTLYHLGSLDAALRDHGLKGVF